MHCEGNSGPADGARCHIGFVPQSQMRTWYINAWTLIAPVYCPPLPPPSHRTGNSISRGVNVGADASRASALTQGIEISLCLISKGIAPTGPPLGWRTQSRDPLVVMIWLRNRNGKFHCLEKEDPTIPLSLTLFFFFFFL